MSLTAAQLQTLKTAIAANTTHITVNGVDVAINAISVSGARFNVN